jgi:hypothetical protein
MTAETLALVAGTSDLDQLDLTRNELLGAALDAEEALAREMATLEGFRRCSIEAPLSDELNADVHAQLELVEAAARRVDHFRGLWCTAEGSWWAAELTLRNVHRPAA